MKSRPLPPLPNAETTPESSSGAQGAGGVKSRLRPSAVPSAPASYSAADDSEPASVGLDVSPVSKSSFWAVAPGWMKALMLLVALGGLFVAGRWANSQGVFATPKGPVAREADPDSAAGLVVTPLSAGNWIPFGRDADCNIGKRITIYSGSEPMSDYRLEFSGQIEKKAMGWVFRASGSGSYYVGKLVITKPGLQPKLSLVHFAMINGREAGVSEIPLAIAAHADTLYKIRLDVIGDTFKTYVQGELVDTWVDGRLKAGGVGLHTDKGESATMGRMIVARLSRKLQ